LVAEGFRYFTLSVKNKRQRKLAFVLLAVLVAISYSYQFLAANPNELVTKEVSIPDLDFGQPTKLAIRPRLACLKPAIEKQVKSGAEYYLAIVSYDKGYSLHDEIVYNAADLENSKLIWAFDLGEEKNKALIEHYPGRKVLHMGVAGSVVKIEPFVKTAD
jgi:hypothetical protein